MENNPDEIEVEFESITQCGVDYSTARLSHEDTQVIGTGLTWLAIILGLGILIAITYEWLRRRS